MGKPFDFLKTTNEWLESVPGKVMKSFENFIGDGQDVTQSKVDAICIWLAWKVNIQIERVRQRVLKSLYGMYKNTVGGKVMQTATVIQDFVSDPLGAVGSFASAIFSPVKSVLNWYNMLVKEIPRLAQNLANIASSLPPTPPTPRISYSKFKIKVNPISIATITSDPNKLPAPEVMFPEPPKPFSIGNFEKSFTQGSAKLKSTQVKYKPSKEDEATLGVISQEILKATSEIDDINF